MTIELLFTGLFVLVVVIAGARWHFRRAFISYASPDANIVERHVVDLLKTVLRVFFAPRSLRGGDQWQRKIYRAISWCSVFYVCWCAHAKQSEWVQRELALATDKRKRIVPVLLDDTPLTKELEGRQYVDLRDRWLHGGPPGGGGFRSLLAHLAEPGRIEHVKAAREPARRLVSAIGLCLVALGLLRPFPIPLTAAPELPEIISFGVLACGAWLLLSAAAQKLSRSIEPSWTMRGIYSIFGFPPSRSGEQILSDLQEALRRTGHTSELSRRETVGYAGPVVAL